MTTKLAQENEPLQSLMERRAQRILSPLESFVRQQALAGFLLLLAIGLALFIANSARNGQMDVVTHMRLGIYLEEFSFGLTITQWVSDGLLALFFFLIGLEIKREMIIGQFRHPEKALLVLAAALGGMVMPALIYTAFNYDTPARHGWAVPMTTDTAFAIGVLALLAKRVSVSASLFLAAIAIIDDIITIAIIAFFYTENLNTNAILMALIPLALLFGCNAMGIRKGWVFGALGFTLWWYIHASGVHATLAGLLMALAVPARPRIGQIRFMEKIRSQLSDFEKGNPSGQTILTSDSQHQLAHDMGATVRAASTPLQRWHSLFESPIAIIVLPLFALLNAGIQLSVQSFADSLSSPVTLGIICGLIIGKPVGITLFSLLAIRAGIAKMPQGVNIRELVGIGILSGIGFTMSLFIALLGFEQSPEMVIPAKIGILLSSFIAALLGTCWLIYPRRKIRPSFPASAIR